MAKSLDPKTLTADWSYPTDIRFGPGRIVELPALCREKGISRPLVVIDPGLRALPMGQGVETAISAGFPSAVVFSEIQSDPRSADVAAGVAVFQNGGHDGVIAVGGGSALDAGKAIAFMAGQRRPLADFEDVGDNWRQAVASKIAPILAVPTTAGTGSEVGRAAVIADDDTGVKRIVFHPGMMPRAVIADPALTVGLPPALTAATGMDALTHCLEAYCARGFHPFADGIALEGLRLCARWLPKAFADGGDLAARAHMLAAASMGATAFQKGLGAVHAISHAVGALYGTHHGLTNAVVLPYVLAFNRPAIEEKMKTLARTIGLQSEGFEGVLDWILTLRRTLEIPDNLAVLGVETARCEDIAKLAYDDPTRLGNPRSMEINDLSSITTAAVEGRIQRS